MGDSRSSEKELMMAGRLYYAVRDPQLLADRNACRLLCAEYNATEGHEEERRTQILARMFKSIDLDDPPLIEPPFTCDYEPQGYNIALGRGVYMNFGCIFLDGNLITIGADTLLGPNVQFYPPGHPIDGNVRAGTRGPEFAHPISVGKNCWIGGSVIIMGGVTIGDNVVIGAGSVLTKSFPDWVLIGGNPAKIIRRIQPGDKTIKEIP